MLIHKPHCKQKEQGENRMNILVSLLNLELEQSVCCAQFIVIRVQCCHITINKMNIKIKHLFVCPFLHIYVYVRGNE